AEEARRVLEDIAGARLRAGAGARAHAAAADDATLAAVHALGVELGTCDDIDQLGRVLVEALRRPPFSYAHAALWLVDGASEPRLVKSAGDARTGGALTTRPLRVGAREVARLEFAGPKRGARTDALVDLVPWLVLAVDRALLAGVVRAHAPAAQAAADDSDAEFERRLERARSSWKLTPRQTACLGRLVRGRSNREISLDLGCTERTVEAHVAVVFRRARIRGRSSLVARFWSEPW
ncbi:MAG TPA: helix-turn-helix transcriptional regulator, partial [Minicystis sp.]|nr:helix-turn-helix transcriptional regulator [Minicystis sp.]